MSSGALSALPRTVGLATAGSGMLRVLASDRRLQWAIVLSLLLHALLLSIRFEFPERAAPDSKASSLEVVLVNARHARAPEEARLLAQANLDGGGTVEEEARPTTPVPPQETRRDGDALMDARRAVPVEAPAPQKVLTRAPDEKPAPALTPRTDPPQRATPAEPTRPAVSGLDLLDSVAAIARMEAQIDKRLNEYAKRPRKQFIGANTREYRFAQYLEDWRLKIERIGTLNYPEAARGRLYGSLLLSVVIRADGSLEKVEVQRSSGQRILDEAAVRIVEMSAPFAPFPPEIRTDTDIIEIVRTWRFTNADQMRAQ
jgi:protein TonB